MIGGAPELRHSCTGDCLGTFICADCGDQVGFCLGSDRRIDLCQNCATTCHHCGERAEGNATLHRDGLDVGPEVEICDACASESGPSAEAIWYECALTGPFAEARKSGVPLAQLLRDVPRAELHDA